MKWTEIFKLKITSKTISVEDKLFVWTVMDADWISLICQLNDSYLYGYTITQWHRYRSVIYINLYDVKDDIMS